MHETGFVRRNMGCVPQLASSSEIFPEDWAEIPEQPVMIMTQMVTMQFAGYSEDIDDALSGKPSLCDLFIGGEATDWKCNLACPRYRLCNLDV